MPMVGKTSVDSQVNPGVFLTARINSAPSAVFAQTWLSDTRDFNSEPSRFATIVSQVTRRLPDGTDVPQFINAPTFFGGSVTSVTYLMAAVNGALRAVHNYEFWT